jgi:pilus assembly protein Flp/PilA
MRVRIAGFFADDSGATAIEYGMIAALIAITILGALYALQGSLYNLNDRGMGRAAAVINQQAATIRQ